MIINVIALKGSTTMVLMIANPVIYHAKVAKIVARIVHLAINNITEL